MEENQPIDQLTEVDYFIQVIDSTSESLISDNSIERNRQLLRQITDGFHDRQNRHEDMPPELAGKVLDIVFSSIAKSGFR